MERRAAMNVRNSPEGTIRGALRYPAFRALLAGLAVSQAGDWLYNIALVTLVYQRTGSAMWAGVTTAARIVPMVVLGPFVLAPVIAAVATAARAAVTGAGVIAGPALGGVLLLL